MNDASPSNRSAQGQRHGFEVNSRVLVGGLLAILALVFIFSNRESARVSFLTIDFSWPLWFLMTVMVLLGMAIGALLMKRRQQRRP